MISNNLKNLFISFLSKYNINQIKETSSNIKSFCKAIVQSPFESRINPIFKSQFEMQKKLPTIGLDDCSKILIEQT